MALAAPVCGSGADNPAEAALTDGGFELEIIGLTGGMENNLFNLGNVNADLSDPAAMEDFLSIMEGGWFRADLQGRARLGMSIGAFSLHVRPWITGSVHLAPGFGQLVFEGTEPGTTYVLTDSGGNALAALSIDLCGAHSIKLGNSASLAVGGVVHYLLGLGMYDAEVTDGAMQVDEFGNTTYAAEVETYSAYDPNISLDSFSFDDFLGRGFLIDLGVVYSFNDWQLGLVVKNLGPGMTWDNTTFQTASCTGGITAGPDGPEEPTQTTTPLPESTIVYTHTVPMVVGLHGNYEPLDRVTVSAGYEQGLDDGWGVSRTPRLWAGCSWHPWGFLVLGGEVSMQGEQLSYAARCELRLACFWLNAEISTLGGFGNESTGLAGEMGLKLHF